MADNQQKFEAPKVDEVGANKTKIVFKKDGGILQFFRNSTAVGLL